MKTILLSLLLPVLSVFAQDSTGQQRISSPRTNVSYPHSAFTNTAASDVSLTNGLGQAFSLNQLAEQLGALKTKVEQTLPVLSAFNTHFATNTPGAAQSQELATAIGSVLGRALGRNSNQTASASSGGISPGLSNFVQVLNGLGTTNSAGTGQVMLDPSTLSQLQTLESDLRPIAVILQNLRLGTNASGIGGPPWLPSSVGTQPVSPSGSNATPTGR
jgi:hypothetical protein